VSSACAPSFPGRSNPWRSRRGNGRASPTSDVRAAERAPVHSKPHSSWLAPLTCIPPGGLVDHLFEGGTSGRGSIDPQLRLHGLRFDAHPLGVHLLGLLGHSAIRASRSCPRSTATSAARSARRRRSQSQWLACSGCEYRASTSLPPQGAVRGSSLQTRKGL